MTLVTVRKNSTQVAGYFITLDTAHKVAQKNAFEYKGKRHKIWGTEYPPHEVFNDYFAKVDRLDIKAAIARGYEYHEAHQFLLLIIVSVTEVPWPYPPPVTISDAIEDEEALKVKEWLVSLGVDPSDLKWDSRMDHSNIHLKETKFIPDRIDPNPPKPRDPWMTFKLGDPPSTWCITPDDFEKCKWNEETMEIIRGSWNKEGEGVQKGDSEGGESSGKDTETE